MKTLLSLLLLLIPFTAFAQDVEQARWHLEQALELLEEDETPIENLTAQWDGIALEIAWENNSSEEIDIQYSRVGMEKVHSIQWMLHSPDYHPPALNIGQQTYTIGSPPNDSYQIVVGTGNWDGDWFQFSYSDTVFVDEQIVAVPDTLREINMGMWYGGSWGNIEKVWVDDVSESSGRIIPFIGNFSSDDSENKWRSRLSNKGSEFAGIDPERVEYIILDDEPYASGFTTAQLERLIDIAREEIGDYKYGFTFARTNVVDEPTLPQNMDVLGMNFYPFYLDHIYWHPQITTEQEFYDFFDEVMEIARSKAPAGMEFSITGQGFYDIPDGKEKWRKPPVDSPLWYANFINENEDITTFLWFLEDTNRSWVGVNDMPLFRENVESVYQSLQPGK